MFGSQLRRENNRLRQQVTNLSHARNAAVEVATERLAWANEAEVKLLTVRAELEERTGQVQRLMEALAWFVVVPDDVSTLDTPAEDPRCPACPSMTVEVAS